VLSYSEVNYSLSNYMKAYVLGMDENDTPVILHIKIDDGKAEI
jgi:hypothetical protein